MISDLRWLQLISEFRAQRTGVATQRNRRRHGHGGGDSRIKDRLQVAALIPRKG